MIRYICDKCKEEILDELYFSRNIEGRTYHYCMKCAVKLTGIINEPEPHPAPKPIPDKPKQKPAQKKQPGKKLGQDKIDTLKALWESNRSGCRAKAWTVKQMADEVGCSEVTVSNYIKLFEAETA